MIETRYFKNYRGGVIYGLSTNSGEIEVDKSEYVRLKAEIAEIAAWVDRVYADPAQVEQVPAEWRENVLRQVEERRQAEQEAQNADISFEELGAMLMEVL